MKKPFAAFALSGLVAAVSSQQPVPTSRGDVPRTLALLVGIAKYPEGSEFPALAGPTNDLERAVETLEQRFGFAKSTILTLADEQATHANIVRAIKTHLIDRAGPDTHVVLWFSGHGSRIPDASGKDSSSNDTDAAVDETFLAWDSRLEGRSGSYDVSDDELFTLLSAVKSKNLVLIADCCHSSGLLRGAVEPGVREAPEGSVPTNRKLTEAFWPAGLDWRDDDNWREVLPDLVLVAACGSHQEAGEIAMGGRIYGTLSWFLSQVLSTADKNATWSAVGREVRALAAGVGSRHQFVEVGGASDRAIFGGSGVDVPSGYYRVDWFDQRQTRQLLVGAGRLQGIGIGATLDVFDVTGAKIGTARVDKVAPTSSNATWTGDGKPPLGVMRAFPQSLGKAAHRLRVFAEGVDAALLESPVVEVVADRADGEYVARKNADAVELWKTDGKCVRRMQATADDVRLGLLKEHHFRFLWEAAAVPGQFPLEVRVEPAKPEEIERMRVKAAPAALHDFVTGAGYAAATVVVDRFRGNDAGGGFVKLSITNRTKERLHVALVSASEDREVNVLFGKTPDNTLGPGDTYPKLVWVGVGETWPDEVMRDRYIVVATRGYADFKPFVSGATAVTRGAENAELPPFLREALGASRTRGDTESPNWGVGVCELQLTTPKRFGDRKRGGAAKPTKAATEARSAK